MCRWRGGGDFVRVWGVYNFSEVLNLEYPVTFFLSVMYINKVRMFVCHLCKYDFFLIQQKKNWRVTRKEKVVLQ